MFPVTMLFVKKYRKTVLAIYLIGFLVAIMGIKRSVLISAVAGIITYLLAKQRVTLLIRATLILVDWDLSIIPAFPKLVSLFQVRFEARGERVELTEETIETEGRISEIRRL